MGTTEPAAAATFGVDSMVAPLRWVAMRAPGAILSADHERWHYAHPLDPDSLRRQYDRFAELVAAAGATIEWLPESSDDDLADSVFTYDPSFVIPDGAIILRPGKALRAGESELHHRFFAEHGIPVLGRIEAPGIVEGGDCFWLDARTLAVGRGFRSNGPGIEQFTDIVGRYGIEVAVFDLPYHLGPEACLHLLSVVSPVDDDLALIHEPLLPTALWELLGDRGYELVVAPPDEFEASVGLSLNVLATAPRQLIAVDGFPATVAALRAAGCEVATFDADALCIPCEGGPTCLTRPLWRA